MSTTTRTRSYSAAERARSRLSVPTVSRVLRTIVLYFFVILIGAMMVIPFAWMLGTSFKPIDETIAWPPNFIPKHPTLGAYEHVVATIPIVRFFLNSVISAVAVTLITIFTSSLAGYIFAKFTFPGNNVLFFLIISTMMIPFQVVLIPVYLIVRWLGITNTLWALIIPRVVNAWGIFLMRQSMKSVPDELLDAARIDGASEMGIFVRIVMPISRTSISALAIFIFMFMWNDYIWPLIVLDDLLVKTLPLGLATFAAGFGIVKWNIVMAGTVLTVLPIILFFVVAQRSLIEGLTLGSVKG